MDKESIVLRTLTTPRLLKGFWLQVRLLERWSDKVFVGPNSLPRKAACRIS